MLKYFPLSTQVKADVMHLLVVLAMYIVAGWVVGLVSGLLTWIPLIGSIIGLVVWLFRLYCTVGLILAICYYFNIVK